MYFLRPVTNVAALAAGAGSFAPSQLTTLKYWFKAGDLVGSDNDPIQTLTDASGTGNDATQATSARRALLDTVNLLNSRNVLEFVATSNHFYTWSNVFSAFTEGMAFIVCKMTSDPAGTSTFSGGWLKLGTQAGANGSNHFTFTSDSSVYDDFGSTVRKSCGNPTPGLTSWRIVSFHSKSASWEFYIDGTSAFTTATNTAGFSTAPQIGKSTGGVDTYVGGLLAELCIFNNFETTLNRQKMEGYLAWRHGLQAQLPGGHPYAGAPP